MSGPAGYETDPETIFKRNNVQVKQAHDDNMVVRMDEDGTENVEKAIKFPPLPVPFREWDTTRDNRYSGEMKEIHRRVQHKLYKFWLMWVKLRTCLPLEELLCRQEEDKQCDAFLAKNTIVDMLDEMAKILIDTPLVEEIIALFDPELKPPELKEVDKEGRVEK